LRQKFAIGCLFPRALESFTAAGREPSSTEDSQRAAGAFAVTGAASQPLQEIPCYRGSSWSLGHFRQFLQRHHLDQISWQIRPSSLEALAAKAARISLLSYLLFQEQWASRFQPPCPQEPLYRQTSQVLSDYFQIIRGMFYTELPLLKDTFIVLQGLSLQFEPYSHSVFLDNAAKPPHKW